MEFNFTSLPREARGKLLNAPVVPRPIAWVVTCQPGGGTNAAPFFFSNVVSTEPPLLCVGMAQLSHLTSRGACKPLMLLGWQRAEPDCGAKAGVQSRR